MLRDAKNTVQDYKMVFDTPIFVDLHWSKEGKRQMGVNPLKTFLSNTRLAE